MNLCVVLKQAELLFLNGEPKEWFCVQKGVWQRDPLSLLVDVLSHLVSRAVANGETKGVKVDSEEIVESHFQMILFCS